MHYALMRIPFHHSSVNEDEDHASDGADPDKFYQDEDSEDDEDQDSKGDEDRDSKRDTKTSVKEKVNAQWRGVIDEKNEQALY
ncbi:hypothetical protein BT96DRAFT_987310 [Gymnopus androsaceus JB14]|uniref:Uncharacterized protein n=1 Tax=Gymnopus androsaceus JB14 TaxID=1447944 RepID=A0A6A4IAC4_9AGAR|nr:hypothetical protein BT96DRAFT_987310 [Gymnopus androsaceus JB14]